MTNKIEDTIALFASNINEAVKRVPSLSFYKGFLVRDIEGKKFLVIQADKIQESKEFMLQEKLTGLEINMSLGYPKLTIEFLKDFTFIEMLKVIHQPLYETDAINQLHILKYLVLILTFIPYSILIIFLGLKNVVFIGLQTPKIYFLAIRLKS